MFQVPIQSNVLPVPAPVPAHFIEPQLPPKKPLRVKLIKPMRVPKDLRQAVDADFADQVPQFNLRADAPLEGNERLVLDPNADAEDPAMILISDEQGTRRVKMTPEQAAEHQRRTMFKQAFEAQELTFDDLLPDRIRACYRLIREMGRIRGMVQDNESLDFALKPRTYNPDLWTIPEKYNRPRDGRVINNDIIDLMLAAENLPHAWRIRRWDFVTDELREYPGVALLPPDVPKMFLDESGQVLPFYNPEQDTTLRAYMAILTKVYDRLGVEFGSRNNPLMGAYGIQGVFDPCFIRAVFPTKIQILTWEQILIDEVLDWMIEGTQRAVRRKLFDKYGFTEKEGETLIKLAQARAMQQSCGDKDVNRSIILMKVEDYIKRSRDALDLKAEMNGLKQMAMIMGLTHEQEENVMTDFIQLMQKVNAERIAERRTFAPPGVKQVENTAPAQGSVNGPTHQHNPAA